MRKSSPPNILLMMIVNISGAIVTNENANTYSTLRRPLRTSIVYETANTAAIMHQLPITAEFIFLLYSFFFIESIPFNVEILNPKLIKIISFSLNKFKSLVQI